MSKLFRRLWNPARGFLEKYFILVAAVVIYGYYLLTSINLIEHSNIQKGFLDYVLQFDSLILMWVIAAVFVQLQKFRKERNEQEAYRQKIQHEFERRRIHLQVLDEITALLQDNVNNPLAVISITSQTIRRKFEHDDEILGWLDRIDASLQRVHATINDIKAYQTQKIVQDTTKETESANA
jgi:signal transduction histidine kinase